MGVADRTYMRGAPEGRAVPATHLVLGVLVGFFILGLVAQSSRSDFLGWMQLETPGAEPWQWLTYALLHGDFWHLLGNGLLLWWVGPLVEAELGRAGLLRILLLGTLAGAVAWFLTGLGGGAPSVLIGASAAVLAAMALGLDGREDESVTLLLFFFLPVTLKVRWVMAFIWVTAVCGWAFSEFPGRHAWSAWTPAWHSTIAHSAHLGGLVVGWLAARRLRAQAEAGLVLQESRPETESFPRPRAARPLPEPTPEPPASLGARAELDRLLDKISAEGFGSLTSEERRRLDELSQRLR
jgi:membrane associated rhomboid family serine protease